MSIFGSVLHSLCRYCTCNCVCHVEIEEEKVDLHCMSATTDHSLLNAVVRQLGTISDTTEPSDVQKIGLLRCRLHCLWLGIDQKKIDQHALTAIDVDSILQEAATSFQKEALIYELFAQYKKETPPFISTEVRQDLQNAARLADLAMTTLILLATQNQESALHFTTLTIQEIQDGQFWVKDLSSLNLFNHYMRHDWR